ncbi:Clathrin interactor EPSIN 3 [Apostasia shenzhenica]|uniref:Clathrin interactor EPSIN 3 n=1 Tax=Apostasia shenzhenica TaxID=1088818 RepID=A0A2I0AUP0_9ASPA|nr:Clathrin interactor EPSIN 3 [Apostasia shenzhenica]
MKKAFDQTVRDLKREVNKKVLKVRSIEQKTLDATSNEPCGPHGTVLAEIAHATHNYNDYQLVMAVLWKRIQDTGKNWRHVYKALSVLECLIVHGSERVLDDIREHAYQISILADFQYIDSNGRDQGSNVRRKSQNLVSFVNNKEKVHEARHKVLSNQKMYHNVLSNGTSRPPLSTSDQYNDHFESRYENKREGRYSRGSEKYTRDGDGYGKNHDEHYIGDDYRVVSNGDFQNRSRSQSVDGYSDRSYDDDDCHSNRSVGVREDENFHDQRLFEHKPSAHSIDGPPSYEEATKDSWTDEPDDENESTKTASLLRVNLPSEFKGTSLSKETNHASVDATFGAPVQAHEKEVSSFDEFDPRGSISAAPSAVTTSELDFFGSSFVNSTTSSNLMPPSASTATFQAYKPVNSSMGTNFILESATSSVASKLDENPFGDVPFKAIPQDDLPSNLQESALVSSSHSLFGHAETHLPGSTNMEAARSYDFFNAMGELSNSLSLDCEHSLANSRSSVSEYSMVDSKDDILDGILPRTSPVTVSFQESQPQFLPKGGLFHYADSHAFENPPHSGSFDIQMGQSNPFQQEPSNHLPSDPFSCQAFKPLDSYDIQATQMNPSKHLGISEPQNSQGSPGSYRVQSGDRTSIQPCDSQNSGMSASLYSQKAPVSSQASQSVSPNEKTEVNFPHEQGTYCAQTSQVTSVDQSSAPSNGQLARLNPLQQPGLPPALPSQIAPVSSPAISESFTNDIGVTQVETVNQPVLSAPQIPHPASDPFQALQSAIPYRGQCPQMSPQQAWSLASSMQVASVSSHSFHPGVPTDLPSAQMNLLHQNVLADSSISHGIQNLSTVIPPAALAKSETVTPQNNISLQPNLPGHFITQPNTMMSQAFQPAASTSIQVVQKYLVPEELAAVQASKSIPFSSETAQQAAPNNIQIAKSSIICHSAVPNFLVSSQAPEETHLPKDKFEPKSAVWADTLSRGLVNLNISGPKINPMADIGIDFDDINRKEKRKEAKSSHAPPSSAITMGKAMGAGSGIGRAGANALNPPLNPTIGTGFVIGSMGGGLMGMGGYGGNMNQPSTGMGVGMNIGQIRPLAAMPPHGLGMPGAAYSPMNMGEGYGHQQQHGGNGYR